MKRFIFLFLLLVQILIIGYGNNREYYENLSKLAQKEFDNQNYAKSLEYLIEVNVYAKENHLSNMQMATQRYMGIVYTTISDYEKAMECYQEAYQIVSGKSNTNEMALLNNVARLYLLNNNLCEATEYLDKAYKIAVELKDSIAMLMLLGNMGEVSNKKGNWEQTEKYLNIAMEIIKHFPKNPYIVFIKYVKIEYLYFKKEYNRAEQLALEILNQNKVLDQELKADYLLLLSKIYHQKKNYPQAITFAKASLKNNLKIPTIIERYEHLSNLYRTTNSFSFALLYQDSVIMMKDSLAKLNYQSRVLGEQIQFDRINLEKTLAENKAKQKRNQLIFVFILISVIVLFLLLFYIRSTKNRQLKIVAELERKTYKNEIDMKNRQLISRTLLQLSKNELIEEIITMLSHLPDQLENTELQLIIQKLQSQLKDPADANWKSFLTYFEQTNPSFLSTLKIKHPKLTASDIRLSSYIYLNLDPKEIAKLLHITPESCKKKRKFLAQKLGIPTMEIYRYLTEMV